RGGFFKYLRARQHVPGHREPLSRQVAAPIDARRARMRGDPALRIDHVYLPVIPAFVFVYKNFDDGTQGKTILQQFKTLRPIVWIDERLGCDRAHPAPRVRAEHADREETARDGDAEGAVGAARDDRPGQAALRRTRLSAKASSPTYSCSFVGLMMCSSACSAKLWSMSFSRREPVRTTIGSRPTSRFARSMAITAWPWIFGMFRSSSTRSGFGASAYSPLRATKSSAFS